MLRRPLGAREIRRSLYFTAPFRTIITPPSPPKPQQWVVFGLGNPGAKYVGTRHNVGRDMVQLLSEKFRAPLSLSKHSASYSAPFKVDESWGFSMESLEAQRAHRRANSPNAKADATAKGSGLSTTSSSSRSTSSSVAVPAYVTLANPETYMNLSGSAVYNLSRALHVRPECIIVLHDDLDLPAGTIRLKDGGSSGGQRGMENINVYLGKQNVRRIRFGIGRPPNEASDPADYVLQRFTQAEKQVYFSPASVDTVAHMIFYIIRHGFALASTYFNKPNNNNNNNNSKKSNFNTNNSSTGGGKSQQPQQQQTPNAFPQS